MQYEKVSSGFWERGDVKTFLTPEVREDGDYDLTLLLRADRSFPYMNVTLVVGETLLPGGEKSFSTIKCAVFDEKGNSEGGGISLFQYSSPLGTRHLERGERLSVSVRHDMRREMLPGVADVGVMVVRR